MATATRTQKQTSKTGSKAEALKNHREKGAAKKAAPKKAAAAPKKAAAKKAAPAKKAAAPKKVKEELVRKVKFVKPEEVKKPVFVVPDSPSVKIKELLADNIPTEKEMQKVAITVSDTVMDIPVEDIRVKTNFNKRKDFGDIEGLAQSMDEFGQVQPIKVDAYKDGEKIIYILDDGERRFKAKLHLRTLNDEMKAKHSTVKAIINNRETTEMDRLMIQLLANSGKPFEPLEEAEVLKELRDKYKMKPADIARKTGNSIARVEQLLLLADSSEEEKTMIREKKVSATAVINTSRHEKDATKRVANLKEATKGGGKVKVKDVVSTVQQKKVEGGKDICDEIISLVKAADKKNVDSEVRGYLFDIDVKIRALKKLM